MTLKSTIASSRDRSGRTTREGLSMYQKLGRACAIVLVSMLFAGKVSAQSTTTVWTSIGPTGGTVNAVLADPVNPMILYAATQDNGIFFSTDGGHSWNQSIPLALPAGAVDEGLRAVYALATDSNFIYAGTQTGIYFVPVAGAVAGGALNWTPVSSTGATVLATIPVTSLLFDPVSQILFAASSDTPALGANNGVYAALVTGTPDTSMSWTFSVFPSSTVQPLSTLSLAVVPTLTGAVAGTDLLAGSNSGLWAAPIAGASTPLTWVPGNTPAGTGSVVTAFHSSDLSLPTTTYACIDGVLSYMGDPFDPSGASGPWLVAMGTPSTPFASCTSFVSLSGGAPIGILGTDQGVFATTDSITFGAASALPVAPNVNGLFLLSSGGTNTLYVGGGYGLYSQDPTTLSPAQQWTPIMGAATINQNLDNPRLNNALVVDTAVVGANLYAATNTGASLAFAPVTSQYSEVFASADGGATWTATGLAPLLNNAGGVNVLAVDTTRLILYAGTDVGLYAYTNNTWAPVATAFFTQVNALAIGASNLYVGAQEGLFYAPLSANPAMMLFNATATTDTVTALTVASGVVYEGTVDSTSFAWVFSVPDSATPGTPTRYGSTSLGTRTAHSLVRAGGNLLAATRGNLVQYAASATASWTSADTGSGAISDAANQYVRALYADGANIYAATSSNGVYMSSIGVGFSWVSIDGIGGTALPSRVTYSVRGSGTTLYVGTSAGIATIGGLTPPSTGGGGGTGGGTTGGGSSSGGGADLLLLLLGLAALAITARQRPRTGGARERPRERPWSSNGRFSCSNSCRHRPSRGKNSSICWPRRLFIHRQGALWMN